MASPLSNDTLVVFESRCLWCATDIFDQVKCDICFKTTCIKCSYLRMATEPAVREYQRMCLPCLLKGNCQRCLFILWAEGRIAQLFTP